MGRARRYYSWPIQSWFCHWEAIVIFLLFFQLHLVFICHWYFSSLISWYFKITIDFKPHTLQWIKPLWIFFISWYRHHLDIIVIRTNNFKWNCERKLTAMANEGHELSCLRQENMVTKCHVFGMTFSIQKFEVLPIVIRLRYCGLDSNLKKRGTECLTRPALDQ